MAERAITGRHVLFGLVAFFGVIMAVNAVFLYEALSTYTGVVSNEPYRKGLNYNSRIEDEKRQSEQGWRDEITLGPDGDAITIALVDRSGNPVSGMTLDARLGRPTTEAMDRSIAIKETAPGQYAASFAKLEPGTWQLDLAARELTRERDTIVWRTRKRLQWPMR